MKRTIAAASVAVLGTLAVAETQTFPTKPITPPPDQQSAQALGALQRAEIDKWWPIVKAANIKAE